MPLWDFPFKGLPLPSQRLFQQVHVCVPGEGFFNNPSPVGIDPDSPPAFAAHLPAIAVAGLSRRWDMLERPPVGLRFPGGGGGAEGAFPRSCGNGKRGVRE